MKSWLENIWVSILVIWDFKWYLLFVLVILFMILLLAGSIAYVLSNPELIGQYIGEIIKGIESIK